jgi:hypothetical protein
MSIPETKAVASPAVSLPRYLLTTMQKAATMLSRPGMP